MNFPFKRQVKSFIKKLMGFFKGDGDLSVNDERYKVGIHEIILPANHPLPIFQKTHRLYDRFLPLLAEVIDQKKIIIDVGANIGDSTIAMVQNSKSPIIAFEPSDIFFPFLKLNVARLSPFLKDKIFIFQDIIGTGKIKGNLQHSRGTATIDQLSSRNMSFISLDEKLKGKGEIGLIKVDTDGYDYDVLLSSIKIIEDFEPILFWENQISSGFQEEGFQDLYNTLDSLGYDHIFIFDNYGNLLFEESDFKSLIKLNTYISSQDKGFSTRTIYYTDVLAATEKNYSKVKSALTEFKVQWYK